MDVETPPSDFERSRLDQQLCFALYAATHSMTRAYRPMLAALGITYPQYLVLIVLWENEGLPVGEIAKRLKLDAAALTPLVKRLESLGLIRRERDQRDERVMRIHLTDKSKAMRPEIVDVQCELAGRTGLNHEEIVALRRQLYDLIHSLDAELVNGA
jgi:DNA-binding MarR family transcriptional regulator